MLLNTSMATAAIKPSNSKIFYQLYNKIRCWVAFPINGRILATNLQKSHVENSLQVFIQIQFALNMLSWTDYHSVSQLEQNYKHERF